VGDSSPFKQEGLLVTQIEVAIEVRKMASLLFSLQALPEQRFDRYVFNDKPILTVQRVFKGGRVLSSSYE
jgi:hypothetical protein